MSLSQYPHLHVRTVDGVAVVRLADPEIVFGHDAVRAVGDDLDDLVKRGDNARVVLDLDGVRFVASELLAKVVMLDRKARQAGGRLRLCGLGPTVRDILTVSHLDRLLEIDEDEADALAWFGRQAAP
jgi:anti-sigma B factor antagonist